MAEIAAKEKYETGAQKVRAFLAAELALPPEAINLTSRLRQDLKMDGVDAANIIEAFALTFDVDIGAFRINDYFSPEGIGAVSASLPYAFSLLLWVFGNARPLKTLTVADLVRAFESRKLT